MKSPKKLSEMKNRTLEVGEIIKADIIGPGFVVEQFIFRGVGKYFAHNLVYARAVILGSAGKRKYNCNRCCGNECFHLFVF